MALNPGFRGSRRLNRMPPPQFVILFQPGVPFLTAAHANDFFQFFSCQVVNCATIPDATRLRIHPQPGGLEEGVAVH